MLTDHDQWVMRTLLILSTILVVASYCYRFAITDRSYTYADRATKPAAIVHTDPTE